MTRRLTVVAAVLFTAAFMQAVDPAPIQRMAATERAFAATAAELGVRDAFLTYFADDAISIQAGADGAHMTVEPAKDGLRKLAQPVLPLANQLIWAPFTGHVSSDGSLGWLTGAYTNFNLATKQIVGKGAYFSVWTRQGDGTWRVWLDEGIGLPQVWERAAPFRAAPEPDAGTAGTGTETIAAAEAAVAGGGAAWQARLAADLRLHRDGTMPLVGRDAVIDWSKVWFAAPRYVVVRTLAAASGDLGVTVGGYDLPPSEHGTWVRVWKRDMTGRWRIVFETSKAAR